MMELPKRKQIRLREYDYSSAGAYFVTVCVEGRHHLFGEITKDDVGAHLCVRPNRPDLLITKWLLEIQNKYTGVFVDCYNVMPDHVHFVLVITGEHTGSPLPEMVQWFKTQTTNEYIRGVKKGLYQPFTKKLWQRNYFEHIIRNRDDLLETRRYIEANPLRWYYKHNMKE